MPSLRFDVSDFLIGGLNDHAFVASGDDLFGSGTGRFVRSALESDGSGWSSKQAIIADRDGTADFGRVQAGGANGAADENYLVDDAFYLARNYDVFTSGMDPDVHYDAFGWREGRDPSTHFSTTAYLNANPDVRSAGINPLMHYDLYGWREGRDASANFDTTLYLANNPDVRQAGINPLLHYLQFGQAEGRAAYLMIGDANAIDANGFDRAFYLMSNSDVAVSGADPLQHFLQFGWKEGRDPNAWFDTSEYLRVYSDVAAAGVNPLDHYNNWGWKEGRDPSAGFDTSSYLAFNPDVQQAGINPLTHYLEHGALELRSARGDGVFDAPQPIVSNNNFTETGAPNDSIGQAQTIDRNRLSVTANGDLPDASLPSGRIQGSISTTADVDFFSIWLQAGEQLILDVDGTTSLDSLVRVYGTTGSQLAENDDSISFDPGSSAHSGVAHNLDSLIRFRAPDSGMYKFSIQSYADASGGTSSGSYTLNVSIGPPASEAQLAQENVQALISGSSWQTSNLTYGFPTSATQYAAGEASEERGSFQAFVPAQQAAARTILGQIAALTGLNFSELTTNPGSAQLRFAQTLDGETAHGYYPGPGNGGDTWYNSDGTYANPTRGNYAWVTFLHEVGHALGMKHGHEAPAITSDRDSLEYSVMTYRSFPGASTGEDGGYTNEQWGYPQTYMMYDIAALQQVYGADFGTNAGNTVYSWNPQTGGFTINGQLQWTPGGNRVFMTIWDGGGTDTYDFSNYSDASTAPSIDLRPGHWTTFSKVQLAYLGGGQYADGNVANALTYGGDARSLIENAIGTPGKDIMIGNDVANRLTGGADADTFEFRTLSQSSLAAPDTITDFVPGSDRLGLASLDANAATAADDAFRFIGTGAFSNSAGELRFEVTGGNTHVYGDVNGDGTADVHIILLGVANVTSTDFFL